MLKEMIARAETRCNTLLAEEKWNQALRFHHAIQKAQAEQDRARSARMQQKVNELISWTGIQL